MTELKSITCIASTGGLEGDKGLHHYTVICSKCCRPTDFFATSKHFSAKLQTKFVFKSIQLLEDFVPNPNSLSGKDSAPGLCWALQTTIIAIPTISGSAPVSSRFLICLVSYGYHWRQTKWQCCNEASAQNLCCFDQRHMSRQISSEFDLT